MDTNTKPRLGFFDRALLEDAQKKIVKAQRRGVAPMMRVYKPKYVALLEARGWRVHTHTPVSYGAHESWLMTHP